MKNIKQTIMLAAVGGVLTAALSYAAEIKYGYVSKTAAGATNAAVIFPAGEGALRITSLDVTDDSTGVGLLYVYSGTTYQAATAASLTSVSNIVVGNNASFVSNDVVVVQSATTDATFTGTVWGTNGTTNIYLTATLGTAVAVGDNVYRMSNVRTNSIGNATLRREGPCIFTGQLYMPVYLRLRGTNAAVTINNVTGYYEPSVRTMHVQ